MEGFYADAATLPEARLDALIVSGAEPRPGDMRQEPWWPGFARLTDWSRGGTISTVFSGHAVHAAVLHLDGIERRPLPQKFSGVVACERVREDALFAGLPAINAVPHSAAQWLGGMQKIWWRPWLSGPVTRALWRCRHFHPPANAA